MEAVSKYTPCRRLQRGALLIETLVVIAIVGILASVALPNMRTTLLKSDLEGAQESLATTLDRARALAKSQNVYITVNSVVNTLTIKSGNGMATQTVTLPERVKLMPSSDIVFGPTGTLVGAQSDVWLVPSAGNDGTQGRRIVVTALGTAIIDRTSTSPPKTP